MRVSPLFKALTEIRKEKSVPWCRYCTYKVTTEDTFELLITTSSLHPILESAMESESDEASDDAERKSRSRSADLLCSAQACSAAATGASQGGGGGVSEEARDTSGNTPT